MPIINPATINTILNTAPVIIQGATRLVKMIRNRGKDDEQEAIPETLEGLKSRMQRLEARMQSSDDFDVQQIEYIEQLAKHNEMLAQSLRRVLFRINILTTLAIVALMVAGLAVWWAVG